MHYIISFRLFESHCNCDALLSKQTADAWSMYIEYVWCTSLVECLRYGENACIYFCYLMIVYWIDWGLVIVRQSNVIIVGSEWIIACSTPSLLSVETLRTYFRDVWIKIYLQKYFKPSIKWRPLRLGLDMSIASAIWSSGRKRVVLCQYLWWSNLEPSKPAYKQYNVMKNHNMTKQAALRFYNANIWYMDIYILTNLNPFKHFKCYFCFSLSNLLFLCAYLYQNWRPNQCFKGLTPEIVNKYNGLYSIDPAPLHVNAGGSALDMEL